MPFVINDGGCKFVKYEDVQQLERELHELRRINQNMCNQIHTRPGAMDKLKTMLNQ